MSFALPADDLDTFRLGAKGVCGGWPGAKKWPKFDEQL